MLIVRGANNKDYPIISKMVGDYKFNLDIKHLERLIVVEETSTGTIVAVGSLVTLLESMFLTDLSQPKIVRVGAMKMLVSQANREVKALGYESYHAFTEIPLVEKTLVKHFDFNPVKGNNLIKWID